MNKPKAIVLGIAIGVILFTATVWVVVGNPFLFQKRHNLQPVRVMQSSLLYWLPECGRYTTLRAGHFFEVATAQESTLSGYRLAKGNCPPQSIADRTVLERDLFGELRASPEMLERFRQNQAQRALADQMDEIKSQQDDIQSQQDDLQRKLDDIETDRLY